MTAADALFNDRALRGHLHCRREQDGDQRFVVFWKGTANQAKRWVRFRVDDNTLTLVDSGSGDA